MRTSRFFINEPLTAGSEVALDEKQAHYVSKVLRLARGSEIVLFNGDGHDYRCRLEIVSRGSTRALVMEPMVNATESPLRVTLSQALCRGERMDYCLQKSTELGVACVQLLYSERVELRLEGDRLERRLEHWRGVIQSASEQCGRATVPELRPPISLDGWAALPGPRLVLDAGAGSSLAPIARRDEVDFAVGPEGGFSQAELERLGRAGVIAVRLGPRVLRTETAGPAAIAVLQALAGDLA